MRKHGCRLNRNSVDTCCVFLPLLWTFCISPVACFCRVQCVCVCVAEHRCPSCVAWPRLLCELSDSRSCFPRTWSPRHMWPTVIKRNRGNQVLRRRMWGPKSAEWSMCVWDSLTYIRVLGNVGLLFLSLLWVSPLFNDFSWSPSQTT